VRLRGFWASDRLATLFWQCAEKHAVVVVEVRSVSCHGDKRGDVLGTKYLRVESTPITIACASHISWASFRHIEGKDQLRDCKHVWGQ